MNDQKENGILKKIAKIEQANEIELSEEMKKLDNLNQLQDTEHNELMAKIKDNKKDADAKLEEMKNEYEERIGMAISRITNRKE